MYNRVNENIQHYFARRKSLPREIYDVSMVINNDGLMIGYSGMGMDQDNKGCTTIPHQYEQLSKAWIHEILWIIASKAVAGTNYFIEMNFEERSRYIGIFAKNLPESICKHLMDVKAEININGVRFVLFSTYPTKTFADIQCDTLSDNEWDDYVTFKKKVLADDYNSGIDDIWDKIYYRLHHKKLIEQQRLWKETSDQIFYNLLKVFASGWKNNTVNVLEDSENTLRLTKSTDVNSIQYINDIITDIRYFNDMIPDSDMISQKLYELEEVILNSTEGKTDIAPNRVVLKYIPNCISLVKRYTEMSLRDKKKNVMITSEMLDNAIFAIRSEAESEAMWKQFDFEAEAKAVSSILGASKSISDVLDSRKVEPSMLKSIEDIGVTIQGYDDRNIICGAPTDENVSVYISFKNDAPDAKISVDGKLLDKNDIYKPEYKEYIELAQSILYAIES